MKYSIHFQTHYSLIKQAKKFKLALNLNVFVILKKKLTITQKQRSNKTRINFYNKEKDFRNDHSNKQFFP